MQVRQTPEAAEIKNIIPRTKITHLPQLTKKAAIMMVPNSVLLKTSSGGMVFLGIRLLVQS